MTDSIKLCSQCKNSTIGFTHKSGSPYEVKCLKSPKVCTKRDYVFNGETFEHFSCDRTRNDEELCGHDAKWFEQREEPKAPWYKRIWRFIVNEATKPTTNFGPG